MCRDHRNSTPLYSWQASNVYKKQVYLQTAFSGQGAHRRGRCKSSAKCEKELIEEREGFIKAGRDEQVHELTRNIEIIDSYLPKMLSDEEIKNIIASLDDKSTPAVMKHFKTNYASQVDMKKVSDALKNL